MESTKRLATLLQAFITLDLEVLHLVNLLAP